MPGPSFTTVFASDDDQMAGLTNGIRAFNPTSDGRVLYWSCGSYSSPDSTLIYTAPKRLYAAWQHFAMVASQSGNYMRVYRNGVLEAEKAGMSPVTYSPTRRLIWADTWVGGTKAEWMSSAFGAWPAARRKSKRTCIGLWPRKPPAWCLLAHGRRRGHDCHGRHRQPLERHGGRPHWVGSTARHSRVRQDWQRDDSISGSAGRVLPGEKVTTPDLFSTGTPIVVADNISAKPVRDGDRSGRRVRPVVVLSGGEAAMRCAPRAPVRFLYQTSAAQVFNTVMAAVAWAQATTAGGGRPETGDGEQRPVVDFE